MIVNTDIDIDVADRKKLLDIIPHTPAMMKPKGKEQRHAASSCKKGKKEKNKGTQLRAV